MAPIAVELDESKPNYFSVGQYKELAGGPKGFSRELETVGTEEHTAAKVGWKDMLDRGYESDNGAVSALLTHMEPQPEVRSSSTVQAP